MSDAMKYNAARPDPISVAGYIARYYRIQKNVHGPELAEIFTDAVKAGEQVLAGKRGIPIQQAMDLVQKNRRGSHAREKAVYIPFARKWIMKGITGGFGVDVSFGSMDHHGGPYFPFQSKWYEPSNRFLMGPAILYNHPGTDNATPGGQSPSSSYSPMKESEVNKMCQSVNFPSADCEAAKQELSQMGILIRDVKGSGQP